MKVRHEGVFLVGGVGLGQGMRGLLAGEFVAVELRDRGTGEFGVSSLLLGELAGSPLARAVSPFVDLTRRRGVTWLDPRVTAEVQYNEMTGGRLRAPILRKIERTGESRP